MSMDSLTQLIGKTIVGIELDAAQQHFLRFTLEGGERLCYYAEGDCCSESWFAEVLGVDRLIGATVREVRDNPLPGYKVDDGRGRQDFDEVYGYTLITGRGHADVIFRNSSNGYYGGSLELVRSGEPDEPEARMEPLTKDYP